MTGRGKAVNKEKRDFESLDPREQMISLWKMVHRLAPLASLVNDVEDTCREALERLQVVEERYRDRDVEDEAREFVKEVGGAREGGSPVAQYHNGHLVNRVDFTTGQRDEHPRSASSQGLAPVEESKLDSSYKRSNEDKSLSCSHSSLMIRSLFSKSNGTIGGQIERPEPHIFMKSKMMNKRAVLNVGGERHEVLWRTLEQIPYSRLGKLAVASSYESVMEQADYYSLIDNEFFFDRHPRSFKTILNYYRTGRLHATDEMCVIAFSDDLTYWGIEDLWLESCCQNKYMSRKEVIDDVMMKEAQDLKNEEAEVWTDNCCGRSQKFLWDLFEKPESSLGAKVISWVSVLFVVVSTVAMVIGTLPALQGPPDDTGRPTDNEAISMIETICITWFTLEYILRFAGAAQKCGFLKDTMNIVDVLAIAPYFVTLIIFESMPEGEDNEGFNEIRRIVGVFRIMRILRVFKLARHSKGLQSIAYTLKTSYKELALLVLFMSMGVLVFASLVFFAEKEEEGTPFVSIPTTFWWAIISMTTVGYGDMYPSSGIGMFLGACTAVSGVLVIALPVPIVVNNFAEFYRDTARKEVSLKRREEKLARVKEEEAITKQMEEEERARILEESQAL